MDRLTYLAEEYRQWRQPSAFRIPARGARRAHPAFEAELSALRDSIRTLSDPAFLERVQRFTAADDQSFITDCLTRLWRLRKSLHQSGGREPLPEAQRALDQLDRLFSKFETMDLRLEDREGDHYDAGLAMKVVSSEPMEGIGREIIKETYKPGIYRGNHLIQTPEVIIGLPIIEPETKAESSSPTESKTKEKAEVEAQTDIKPEAEIKADKAGKSDIPTLAENLKTAPPAANYQQQPAEQSTGKSKTQPPDETNAQTR